MWINLNDSSYVFEDGKMVSKVFILGKKKKKKVGMTTTIHGPRTVPQTPHRRFGNSARVFTQQFGTI